MANKKHLKILNQGVETWNRWRENNSTDHPNLAGANLRAADLSGANLRRAWLNEADLDNAKLDYADLEDADLTNADLTSASLSGANLDGTDLTGAFLGHANLYWASFQTAVLEDTNFNKTSMLHTKFADTDLSRTLELETVKHSGPSTIGIDTLYKSRGKIPEAFLRGCGVPEDFITYAHSLVTNPIEYYSSFISHSSRDKEFADRLHADLQPSTSVAGMPQKTSRSATNSAPELKNQSASTTKS